MLNLPVPEAEFINEVLKPSEEQQEMVSAFSERAESVRGGLVNPTEDNMLKITNDGRKLALDQRLADPSLPDDPESKINSCVKNVLQVWRDTAEINKLEQSANYYRQKYFDSANALERMKTKYNELKPSHRPMVSCALSR